MKLRKLFFLFFWITLFFEVSAQKGFEPAFIVKKSDTIFGTGRMSNNQKYCLFKKTVEDDYNTYYPGDVDLFRIVDGKYYVSRQIEEPNGKLEWYFFEFLVQGEINLFLLVSNTSRYFIEKDEDNLIELHDNVKRNVQVEGRDFTMIDRIYIGLIKAYMKDAPELFDRIDGLGSLNQRDLVKLSVDYHNLVCDDYECIDYTKRIPKVLYKLEAVSGINYHNSFYTPHFGFLLHVWRPLISQRLYIKTGIIYSDRPDFRKHTRKNDKYSIKVPLSFQYVIGENAFKPSVGYGYSTGIYFISSLNLGFIYSFSEKMELSFSSSVDGPFLFALPGIYESVFDNRFAHTISFGLLYTLN